MKNQTLPFAESGILPVINIPKLEAALPLAEALMKGGLYALEVTLRSDCSLEAIRLIKDTYPEMTVGAGTVLTCDTVDKAVAAGADFIVSPGYDPEVVDYCIAKDILITPGCVTPSEIQSGLKKGLKIFKFFPAELNGGMDAIKLISGPFPEAVFLPTGGINYSNLGTYLASDKVIACGGSYMATADQIKNGEWETITANCKKAVDISLGFELAHVGINHPDADSAMASAEAISSYFRQPLKVGNSSIFAGTGVECMKMPFHGTNGHIGFKTNSMARALAYFKNNQIAVKEGTIRTDDKGKLVSAYLEQEVGGFAVHVVRK